MTDYIKREDALELFEMVLDSYKDSGIQNIKTMVAIAPQEFHLSEDNEIADFNFELDGWRNNLMEIESADVAPINHARWEEINDLLFDTLYRCSVCGEEFYLEDGTPQENEYHYCPNCGAKMDGESDE